MAAQLSVASGYPARLFVATVDADSLVVAAPPPPPSVAPPQLSEGGKAALAIFVFIGWGLAYVYVWKPLRRGEVTTASLGLEGRAPPAVVQAVDRALKTVDRALKKLPPLPKIERRGIESAKVAPSSDGERPSSAEGSDPTAEGASAAAPTATSAQLAHHWTTTLEAASHEDAALIDLPPLELADKAAAGSAPAQCQLGERYLRGIRGVPKDLALAALWLQRAADAGLPRSEALLGALFLRGDAVFVSAEADFDLGLDLVHRAAEHGVVAAQHLVDRLHEDAHEPQAASGGRRIVAAQQRARELTATPTTAPHLPQQAEQQPQTAAVAAAAAATAPAMAEAMAAAAATALPFSPSSSATASARPGSTASVEEDTLAAAERAAWGANEEEEYQPARRSGPLPPISPRKTAWVEPDAPSFGVPTRHDVLIGARGPGAGRF